MYKSESVKCRQVVTEAERPREAFFSIEVQLYSQNYKIAVLGHPMGHEGQYSLSALSESFNAKKLSSSFIEKMSVLFVKQRSMVSELGYPI